MIDRPSKLIYSADLNDVCITFYLLYVVTLIILNVLFRHMTGTCPWHNQIIWPLDLHFTLNFNYILPNKPVQVYKSMLCIWTYMPTLYTESSRSPTLMEHETHPG